MNSQQPPQRDDWDLMILRYLDGSLPEAELDAVRALLDNDEFQRLLATYALDESTLHETVRHSVPAAALHGNLADEPSLADMRRLSYRMAIGLAAAMLVAVTAGLMALRGNRGAATGARDGVARVEQVIGDVMINDERIASAGWLPGGAPINTRGNTSFALLAFADGTELQLAGDTTVVCQNVAGRKHVTVLAGHVSASVAPQPPDRPLLIQTATASMEVLGTDLAVSAESDQTRLNVASGKVKMRRQPDGEEVTVERGQYAVASTATDLSASPVTPVPDVWSEDFNAALPKGWDRGTFAAKAADAPDGVVQAEYFPADEHWGVTTQNAWSEGLFRIHDDTYINFRIKMDRPEWYQLLLCVRDDRYRVPQGQPLYEAQEVIDFRTLPWGEWRTVSLPISAFKLPVAAFNNPEDAGETFAHRPPGAPPAGVTAFHMAFSTQHSDRGLSIDRIWITRGKPQE